MCNSEDNVYANDITCFNPLYIGSMCNNLVATKGNGKASFNPLYIGSMCNILSLDVDIILLFQSPLYRVNV